jgi:hypothetical protein
MDNSLRRALQIAHRSFNLEAVMVPTISIRPILILTILFLSSATLAQYGASLQGTIQDKSGAAVVGATVTVTNQATGVSRNTDGRFPPRPCVSLTGSLDFHETECYNELLESLRRIEVTT